MLDLTKCQAEKGDKRGSDALQSPGEATGTPSHAVLTAQLAIAEQQAADYQTRMNKLSSFFSDSMQDLRVITQDVLGWRYVHVLLAMPQVPGMYVLLQYICATALLFLL